MTRAGMTDLLSELRGLAHAGTADYTLVGVTYWTDAQLQAELDRAGYTWRMLRLEPVSSLIGGTTFYYDYAIPAGTRWERSTSGTAYWRVTDEVGMTQGTSLYSVDWDRRVITFGADQAGSARYLNGRTYDLNRAAARVWRQKASYYAAEVDWSTDGHRVNASQAYEHCIQMAEELEALAGMGSAQMFRADANRRVG